LTIRRAAAFDADQIKIRGRTYTVRGEESGDTIQSVAQDLDKRMKPRPQLRTSTTTPWP
jgi:cell division protein ZapA (FtsZ GTPase activity inhibitor)